MKRREFLKFLTVAPLAPSVLAVVPKETTIIDDSIRLTGDVDWKMIWDTGPPKAEALELSNDIGEIREVEIPESGWTYIFITADAGDSNDDCTCTLYGIGRDGNYVKIDNYSFLDNKDGTYNINIPEGVI